MTCLSKHCELWQEINAPEFVKKWIEHGVEIPFIKEPDNFESANYKFKVEEEKFLDSKISEYLSKRYHSK